MRYLSRECQRNNALAETSAPEMKHPDEGWEALRTRLWKVARFETVFRPASIESRTQWRQNRISSAVGCYPLKKYTTDDVHLSVS